MAMQEGPRGHEVTREGALSRGGGEGRPRRAPPPPNGTRVSSSVVCVCVCVCVTTMRAIASLCLPRHERGRELSRCCSAGCIHVFCRQADGRAAGSAVRCGARLAGRRGARAPDTTQKGGISCFLSNLWQARQSHSYIYKIYSLRALVLCILYPANPVCSVYFVFRFRVESKYSHECVRPGRFVC